MDYTSLGSQDAITTTVKNLQEHNFQPFVVSTQEEALEKIKELIPPGASVMNGASRTLEEIGFIEYLKSGKHEWKNVHETIVKETDPEKQTQLRKQSVLSDYYIGSAHALSQSGEMVIASNTGSQLPHIAFTSQHVILVIGSQKIVGSLDEAFKRLKEHVIPLEDERMKQVYGYGTMYSKTLILHRENPVMGRTVQVIIVQEKLGF